MKLSNIADASLRIVTHNGKFTYTAQDFGLTAEKLTGKFAGMELQLHLEEKNGGVLFYAEVKGDNALYVSRIEFDFVYREPGVELSARLVPAHPDQAFCALSAVDPDKKNNIETGLFGGRNAPCFYLGTIIPQKNLNQYSIRRLGGDELTYTASTVFTIGQGELDHACSEKMWISSGRRPLETLEAFAALHPDLANRAEPSTGWNSWDSFFAAISHDEMKQELDAVAADPILSKRLKYFVLDDGWQRDWGEWHACWRFPDGMASMAKEISDAGFTPGIWLNGCNVNNMTHFALRTNGRPFIKDQYGDVIGRGDYYIVDPTSPEGRQFYIDTYTQLYKDGYRLFKVDFVNQLLLGVDFYKKDYGVYDAMRELFAIIRECVGPDSHILGCGMSAAVGPNVVDSARISADIHNMWSRYLWTASELGLAWWYNDKLFRIDPDFLIVRGDETSLENETNVYWPGEHAPMTGVVAIDSFRRRPVFDKYEADSWAKLVRISGGNVFAGDRVGLLNDAGLDLLHNNLDTTGATVRPLDLGDGISPSMWYSVSNKNEHSLLLVNLLDHAAQKEFDFDEFGIDAPANVDSSLPIDLGSGKLTVSLERHQSVLVRW